MQLNTIFVLFASIYFDSVKLIKNRIPRMNRRAKNRKYYTTLIQLWLIPVLLSLGSWINPDKAGDNPNVKNWVVVIDAGHGGKDPGSSGKKAGKKILHLHSL